MIAMEEHGVEAAAATAVLFERTAATLEPSNEMNVKWPFVIAIVAEPRAHSCTLEGAARNAGCRFA